MDLTLIKLSLGRLNDNVEALQLINKQLIERIRILEERKILPPEEQEKDTSLIEDELLDTKQVRKILGISHNTLQAIVRRGMLIQKRINNRNVRYSRKNLIEYIKGLG